MPHLQPFQRFPLILFLLPLALFCSTAVAQSVKTRALQMDYQPTLLYGNLAVADSVYRARIDQAAAEGYNTLIFGIGGLVHSAYTIDAPGSLEMKLWGRPGAGQSQIDQMTTDLVSYAQSQGIEPVFSFNTVGKQSSPLSQSLLDANPGLLYTTAAGRTVVDPYYTFAGGMSLYEGIYEPVIDWVKARYPVGNPAKFILTANDEIYVDGLDFFAAQAGVTPIGTANRTAVVYADAVNAVTSGAIAEGLTPILWGDMLLSPELQDANSGVTSWGGDSRFASIAGVTYNANFPASPSISIQSAMNLLTNKQEIIMTDWQYKGGVDINGDQEFPSIDYLQSRSFKEVWAASWWTLNLGIRSLSDYARDRNVDGMMATTWVTGWPSPIATQYGHLYDDVVQDSALLFRQGDQVRTLANFAVVGHDLTFPGFVRADPSDPVQPFDYEVVDPVYFNFKKVTQQSPTTGRLIYTTGTSSLRVEVEKQVGQVLGGVAILDVNSKGLVDLSEVVGETTFEQRLRFGGPTDSNLLTRLLLMDNDDLDFGSNKDWMFVQLFETGSGIRFEVIKQDDSTQQTLLGYTLSSLLSIEEGDLLSVDYSATEVASLTFYDETSETTFDILELADLASGVPHGFDFQTDFGSGATTGLEAVAFANGLKTVFWDRVWSQVNSSTLGDFDDDGDVDGFDFLLWQRNPGVGDLANWEANFGMAAAAAANSVVPEPTAVVLLGFGMLAAAMLRRRVIG